MAVLALPMLFLALIVKYDSKGPVLFWQKRVGIYKKTFMMPKFRTMYTDTPANVPTHLLNDPSRWITNSGKWLRKLSLDELSQIFCIITGKMSVIGPRPALWNQYDLIAERDKYGANDIISCLTGCLVKRRSLFRQGKLSSEQINKLSALNSIGANMSIRRHI